MAGLPAVSLLALPAQGGQKVQEGRQMPAFLLEAAPSEHRCVGNVSRMNFDS